tara:strand:- start:147 stop:494 length:348 start_codon:yes stop_codon:yes gene_type:complete
MRRVQTLPGLLSTGSKIDTTGGHHHADASILSSSLSDDAIGAVQEKVEPTVIALTDAQITQLEHDIMAELNITEQVYAVLQNDTQEAIRERHAIPSENARLNVANMRMFGPDTPL